MAQAMICDVCGETFAQQAPGSQGLNGSEWNDGEGPNHDNNYTPRNYVSVAFDLCPKHAIKKGANATE